MENEYLEKAKELIESVFREEGMSDKVWEEVLRTVLFISSTTYEEIAKEIELAVKSGISIETQIAHIKRLL